MTKAQFEPWYQALYSLILDHAWECDQDEWEFYDMWHYELHVAYHRLSRGRK